MSAICLIDLPLGSQAHHEGIEKLRRQQHEIIHSLLFPPAYAPSEAQAWPQDREQGELTSGCRSS